MTNPENPSPADSQNPLPRRIQALQFPVTWTLCHRWPPDTMTSQARSPQSQASLHVPVGFHWPGHVHRVANPGEKSPVAARVSGDFTPCYLLNSSSNTLSGGNFRLHSRLGGALPVVEHHPQRVQHRIPSNAPIARRKSRDDLSRPCRPSSFTEKRIE